LIIHCKYCLLPNIKENKKFAIREISIIYLKFDDKYIDNTIL
jgi:hypothetical protein